MSINVKREYVYPITVKLYVQECCSCGVVFGVPANLDREHREEGSTFYCPNGHAQVYRKSDTQRERERANAAEQRANQAERAAAWQREQAEIARRERDHQERRARSLKGHLTRARNRIANGICPVPGCKRSGFSNVMRHIASKHPAWHHEHADDFGAVPPSTRSPEG